MADLPSGLVTVLFTDIEGSTSLLRRLDERYDQALVEHFTILRGALAAHGGMEVKTEGDAMFAVFVDAVDAVLACRDAQSALTAHAWPPEGDFRIRMALHTGDVRVRDGEYVGIPVHQAARLTPAAHGGQIICSSATARDSIERLPDGISLHSLGKWALRDFDDPEEIFQVSASGIPGSFPRLRAVPATAHNLPPERTSFIGRERELTELAELVANERLVTITGPGGTGKTRLAFELTRSLATDFRDGATVVPLAPLDDPAQVVSSTAAALGIREEPGHTLADTLVASMARREALVVLDNCEHLAEGVVALVDSLLDRAEGIALIATSRAPLDVPGEAVYPVDPLEVPVGALSTEALAHVQAVRLFVERARSADPSFALSPENADAVAKICSHLDGLPLAIELAAARVRSLSVAAIADRIDDTLGLLTKGARTADARHRTVTSLIDWSYGLLDVDEQRLFARLSVFRGGFDLEGAETVCGSSPLAKDRLVDLLDSLVRNSLVSLDAGGRYRMLVVIRDVANAHLEALGERSCIRDAHLEHFAAIAETAERELTGANQLAYARQLDGGSEDCRAALEWGLRGSGDPRVAATLAGGLARFWTLRGLSAEGRSWAEEALTKVSGPFRLLPLIAAGLLAIDLSDLESASTRLEEAASMARSLGDAFSESRCAGALGRIAYARDDYAAAEAGYGKALAIAREVGDRGGEGVWLGSLGSVAYARGDYAAAEEGYGKAVAVAREVGDRRGEGRWLGNLGGVAYARGDYSAAEEGYLKALAIAREVGDRGGEGHWLGCLGSVAFARGNYDAAEEGYREALAIAREVGDRGGEGVWLGSLGGVAFARGDYDAAEEGYGEALTIAREVGDRGGEGRWLGSLGGVAFARGDYDAAEEGYGEALAIAREVGDRRGEGRWLGSLGGVAFARGDYDAAEEGYGEALAIAREAGDRRREASWLVSLATIAAASADDEEAVRRATLAMQTPEERGHANALLAVSASRRGEALLAESHSLEAVRNLGADSAGRARTLSMVAVALGKSPAAGIGTAVFAWAEAAGYVIAPPLGAWLRSALDAARDAIGPERFEDLRTTMSGKSLEEAAAWVLEELRDDTEAGRSAR